VNNFDERNRVLCKHNLFVVVVVVVVVVVAAAAVAAAISLPQALWCKRATHTH